MTHISRENLEIRPEELKPYAQNARTHSPEQVDQIIAAIKEFGFTNPLLIDEQNGLIAGHGRLLAALKLALPLVPAVRLTGLSEAQKRALVLADNKIAMNAGWDSALLGAELKGLKAMGFDLVMTGFSKVEIGHLMGLGAARGGEEDAPALPRSPRSVLGDLWLLGGHRVKCGDSTIATDVGDVLREDMPNLMVTDPPYGVNYDANWRNEPEKLNMSSGSAMKSKTSAVGKVLNDDRSDWTESWALFPGNVAYIWHGERQSPELVGHMKKCEFEPRNLIVWAKSSLVISRGHYHPQHETCWYFVREGKTANWTGDRKQTTLWEIDKPQKSDSGHSTQKPVECMRRPIINNSSPGDFVYDPFLGSGTTLIAAEGAGRICLGLELNPAYVDVIIGRWQTLTGGEAVHAVTGEKFNERPVIEVAA